MSKTSVRGVTIVTATMRPEHMNQVLSNYNRQIWPAKELIIVLNKDHVNVAAYKRIAHNRPDVRIYALAEGLSLGECLNYAVKRASYPYIAKFDDDDYYGPAYIHEAMQLFKRTKADIVGKKSYYLFFPHRKLLLLRRKSSQPFKLCSQISGATIIFHKRVSNKVKFIRMVSGTDARFLSTCRRRGFHIYTSSKYNFVAIRRHNLRSHTWKITEEKLLSERGNQIIRTKYYKKYVNRSMHVKTSRAIEQVWARYSS